MRLPDAPAGSGADDTAPRRRRRRRWATPAAVAAAVFGVLASPLWAPLLFRRMDFFRLRHVEVAGARYLDAADILARMRADTLLSVWDRTDGMRERIAAHPLVQDVRIERKLPGTLVVRLVEHAPVALVPGAKGLAAYDERGVALPIDPVAADVDAPILFAADARTLHLLGEARTLAPEFYGRVSEVRRAGHAELLIVLDSFPVRAPADVTLQRLTDLELVERDLARRRLRAAELDLRYRDQVIARIQ